MPMPTSEFVVEVIVKVVSDNLYEVDFPMDSQLILRDVTKVVKKVIESSEEQLVIYYRPHLMSTLTFRLIVNQITRNVIRHMGNRRIITVPAEINRSAYSFRQSDAADAIRYSLQYSGDLHSQAWFNTQFMGHFEQD